MLIQSGSLLKNGVNPDLTKGAFTIDNSMSKVGKHVLANCKKLAIS